MRKILSIITAFVVSLSLCSFKSNEEVETISENQMYSYQLVDSVYLDNYLGADYRHDIYKTDRIVKEMNARQITGWAKKADCLNMKVGYKKAISGTLSAKYAGELELDFSLKDIFNATSKVSYERYYSYTEEQMVYCEWEITPDIPGTYICIGLNVKYRVYEINNYKQKFVWFGQGDYVFESMMEVLVPEVEYISLNYMNETDTTIHEYKL